MYINYAILVESGVRCKCNSYNVYFTTECIIMMLTLESSEENVQQCCKHKTDWCIGLLLNDNLLLLYTFFLNFPIIEKKKLPLLLHQKLYISKDGGTYPDLPNANGAPERSSSSSRIESRSRPCISRPLLGINRR